MSGLDILLKSVPIYTNIDEVRRLQAEEPNHDANLEQVSALVDSAIDQMSAQVLADVVVELTQPNVQGCVKDPQEGEKFRSAGNEAFAQKNYETAIRFFSEALRFLDHNADLDARALCSKIHCNRALCLGKIGEHLKAAEDCTAALDLDQTNAKALYRRAVCRRELGEVDAARQDAEHAAGLLRGAAAGEAQVLAASLGAAVGGGGGGSAASPSYTAAAGNGAEKKGEKKKKILFLGRP